MLTDLISPIKDTFWQTRLKGRVNTLLLTKDSSHQQKQAMAYGERLEEGLPSQWPQITGRSSNTYLGQSILHTYIDQMRQRRTLHTNKRGNTPKGNNNN
jgi:hypothetical protein